jgi:hypothetical protein
LEGELVVKIVEVEEEKVRVVKGKRVEDCGLVIVAMEAACVLIEN